MSNKEWLSASQIESDWKNNPRWKGIQRPYSAAEVVKLRSSVAVEHTLASRGAERLWQSLKTEPYVNTMGAYTGAQAVQYVKAGLKALYLSGWQVAGDANMSGSSRSAQCQYTKTCRHCIRKTWNK